MNILITARKAEAEASLAHLLLQELIWWPVQRISQTWDRCNLHTETLFPLRGVSPIFLLRVSGKCCLKGLCKHAHSVCTLWDELNSRGLTDATIQWTTRQTGRLDRLRLDGFTDKVKNHSAIKKKKKKKKRNIYLTWASATQSVISKIRSTSRCYFYFAFQWSCGTRNSGRMKSNTE